MSQVNHVVADQVLLPGGFTPAHLEIVDGRIAAVHTLDDAAAAGLEEQSIPRVAKYARQLGARNPQIEPAHILVPEPHLQVLPGVVDTHVHINEPGRTTWEGFATATAAAAAGGVTTVVDMPLNSIPATVDMQSLKVKKRAATGQLSVDTGFWGGLVPGNTADLRPLWDAGVFGFKCFLLPSGVDEFPPVNPEQLREGMTQIASFGGLVIVHAEDAATVEAGDTAPMSSYAQWAGTRPHEAELVAIAGLLDAVRETGCRTHILHLASARALEMIQDAKAEGLPVTVETCPHYLCFEAENIPAGAAQFKCCPPIRDAGNRDALWQGLTEGIIDVVVSDHSPATAEEKYRGAPDLQAAWGGISGLQVGFTAVAHHARQRGIGIEQVSQWMATRTAELVGLGVKGALDVGRDADLTVYDPTRTHHIHAGELRHKNPVSAYDGLDLTGQVVGTVLRGAQIYDDAGLNSPATGVMLARKQ